ncbi:MAG: hypothetical protein Q4G64_07310 [bacterium]|nr:hypothetical protein [bacterium]
MIRTPARLAAVAAVAAAALAGCQAPGTAAVVNGERVTDREVSALVQDVRTVLGGDVTPAGALSILAMGRALEPLAEEYGEGISEQELLGMVNESRAIYGDPAVGPDDVSDALYDGLRAQFWFSGLQNGTVDPDFSAAAGDALTNVDVTVNPRYGLTGSEDGEPFQPVMAEWIATPTSR